MPTSNTIDLRNVALWLAVIHMFGMWNQTNLTRDTVFMDYMTMQMYPRQLDPNTGRNAQLLIQAARLGRMHRRFQPLFRVMREYFAYQDARIDNRVIFQHDYRYGLVVRSPDVNQRTYDMGYPRGFHTFGLLEPYEGVGLLMIRSGRFANIRDDAAFTYPGDYQLNVADMVEYLQNMHNFQLYLGFVPRFNDALLQGNTHFSMLRCCDTSVQRVRLFYQNFDDSYTTHYSQDLRQSYTRQLDMVFILMWMRQTSYGMFYYNAVEQGGRPMAMQFCDISWVNRLLLNFIHHNPGFFGGVTIRFRNDEFTIEHPMDRYEELRRLIMEVLAELRLLWD